LWVSENGGLKPIRAASKSSEEPPEYLGPQEIPVLLLDFSTETFFILWIILYVSEVTNQSTL
jgi:hypothetical protein